MINELFKDPKKLMYAAKSALAATEMGRSGAVKVDFDSSTGKISYISSVTGERYDTAGEAFVKSSKFLLTDFKELRYGSSRLGDANYQPRFAQAGMFLENLEDNLRNATMAQLNELQRIGIEGINSKSNLIMSILTTKNKKNKTALDTAKELEKIGQGFIPIVDGEGGAFLTMRANVGGELRSLTSTQMHMMSSILGSGVLSVEKLQSALGKEAMPGFVNKLPKRLRAFFSQRDVVMSEEDISKALPKSAAGSIEDNVLRVDSGIDYLRKYSGFSGRRGIGNEFQKTFLDQEYNLIDELLDEKLVKATIENLSESDVDRTILNSRDMKGLIRESNSSKELLGNIETAFGKESQEYKSVNKIVTGIKREFDGITPVNDMLRKSKIRSLQEAIKDLEDQIDAPNISLQQSEVLKERLYQIRNQYNIVDNADNLYQVTLRGGIGQEQPKSAAIFSDFSKIGKVKGLFSGYAAILDEEAIKGELGFNFKGLVFSGLGSSNKNVYADPVSASFIGDLFSSDYDIENIKRYSGEIMQEFNDSVNQNIIPPRIKQMINQTIFDDLDYLPEYMSETRMRNKEFARRIMEMHQSGIAIKDSPQMMNMLAKMHAADMYRVQTKGNVSTYLPVLPDVNRFAVSTEAAALQSGTKLSPESSYTGMQKVSIKNNADDISAELLEFRVNNGRVLFGPGMTDRFFNSLGGFDLDDKVITKMMTYKDNKDVKRLLFGIYRQPSGPEESIYARANLDEGTLRSYFKNERFKGFLDQYRTSVSGLADKTSVDNLSSIIFKGQSYKDINAEDAERLVIDVFDFAETQGKAGLRHLDGSLKGVAGAHNRRILRSIERFGASSLAIDEQYTKPGLFKMLVDEGGIARNKEEGFLIRNELENLLKKDSYKNSLTKGLYNELNEAVRQSQYEQITKIFEANRGNPLLEALKQEAVFSKMFATASVQEASLLGTYVNRSMVVASRLNQTQDLIEELINLRWTRRNN